MKFATKDELKTKTSQTELPFPDFQGPVQTLKIIIFARKNCIVNSKKELSVATL